MSTEGVWRKIDKVERAIAIRIAFPVIIKSVTSYIDYVMILSRLADVTWDNEFRKHIIDCIKKYSENRGRFCCMLNVLGLPRLREKYCKGDC